MLQVAIQKPKMVINCAIVVPESVLTALTLNCANLHQSADPRQRAKAKASDKRAQKQRLIETKPNRFKQLMQTIKNAGDSQFKFDCFDGTKGVQSDMAFMSVLKGFNKKYKDRPITKKTLINAIRQIRPNGYVSSKIMQGSSRHPNRYDNQWSHVWHLPLSAVFGQHADDYEWAYDDEIYVKLVLTSEPRANGKFDPNADIHVASFHRDSDSSLLDYKTGKESSWWSDDTADAEERESMRQSGLEARQSVEGFESED